MPPVWASRSRASSTDGADIPIYLAAIGPKNVELAAEIADGWLPIFFAPRFYDEHLQRACRGRSGQGGQRQSWHNFDIAPSVPVVLSDDVDAARNVIKPFLALYVGGMGAKGKNFYFDLVGRYGFADAAEEIQTHLSERRQGRGGGGRARCVGRRDRALRPQGAHRRATAALGGRAPSRR